MKKEDKEALDKYLKRLEFARSSGGIDPYETKKQKDARIEKAKKDVRFCVEYYFPHYATFKSADFQIKGANMTLKDKKCRQFDQWGRGLAKSVWNNIIIPFWLHIQDQAHYMVVVTVNHDKACDLAEDLRAEFEGNPRIINDFGEQKNQGQWEKGFYVTNSGFICKALGAGQSVRGLRVKAQRPDYIVVDDLETRDSIANPKRQKKYVKWIETDLIPTMDGEIRRFKYANNKFAPVMIQTILQEKHPNWKVHQVNAYNPVTYEPKWKEKYNDEYYKEVEDDIGVLAAKAEYNNKPHIEGEIFKEEQIQWAKLPRLDHFKVIIGFWDIAWTANQLSDFNAVRVWGLKVSDFYYIDSYVKQSKIKAALVWMVNYQMNLPDGVICHFYYEEQFINDEIIRTIEEVEEEYDIILNLTASPNPSGKKYDRILTLQVYYQNSRIYYNEKKKDHNDTSTGLSQLYGIEPGYTTKDDAPDADQQAIEKLSKYISKKSKGNYRTANYERKERF